MADIHNRRPVNTSVAWANSSAANTTKDVDFDVTVDETAKEKTDLSVSERLRTDTGKYVVLVHNPSAVTALTVKAKSRWTDSAAAARVADLRDGSTDKTLAVPANSTKAMVLEGLDVADGARLTLSNDTVLGAGDGFTAQVQVRAL